MAHEVSYGRVFSTCTMASMEIHSTTKAVLAAEADVREAKLHLGQARRRVQQARIARAAAVLAEVDQGTATTEVADAFGMSEGGVRKIVRDRARASGPTATCIEPEELE